MRVYISGPYSRGSEGANVRKAILVADELRQYGHTPFVPHMNHLWNLIAPREYDDWMEWDLEWLGQCEVLVRLPGKSAGGDTEVRHAIKMNIPVYFDIKSFLEDAQVGEVEDA